MKLGMYIMALEPISTAYSINPYDQSLRLYRIGKNVTTARNMHATIEELFKASFSMRSVSYQRKVGD
jgi:hypothetical protein